MLVVCTVFFKAVVMIDAAQDSAERMVYRLTATVDTLAFCYGLLACLQTLKYVLWLKGRLVNDTVQYAEQDIWLILVSFIFPWMIAFKVIPWLTRKAVRHFYPQAVIVPAAFFLERDTITSLGPRRGEEETAKK